MKAGDVMASHVITVGPELDLKAVANTLVANSISAVPFVAIDGSLVGIISEGDLMHRAVSGADRKRSWWLETFSSAEQLMAEFVKAHGRKAKDVMTRQVISVSPNTSLQEIANLLEKHGIKRVPVIENGRLVGIVSRANLVQALATRGLAFVDVAEADEVWACPLPRRIERVLMSITSPLMQPSPHTPEGRHPHCHFRGLLRLYSRFGPPNRSAALRRPLSRGSDPSGCPAEPLVSYRTNRQLSRWNLPPLMVRAFGAHGVMRTSAGRWPDNRDL